MNLVLELQVSFSMKTDIVMDMDIEIIVDVNIRCPRKCIYTL